MKTKMMPLKILSNTSCKLIYLEMTTRIWINKDACQSQVWTETWLQQHSATTTHQHCEQKMTTIDLP